MIAPGLSGRVWQATSMRAFTIALCLLATPALADMAGTALVIDGDTIEVHGHSADTSA